MAIKRVLGGGAYNAIRGIEDFLGGNPTPGDVASLTNFLESKGIRAPSEPWAPSKRSDYLLGALGGPEEIKPRNALERAAQGLTTTGLQYLAGGGPRNIKAFAPAAAGSLAGTAVEEAGFPGLARVAQLGTEFGLRHKALAKQGKFPASLKEHGKAKYEELKSSIKPHEKGSIQPLNKYLEETKSYWKREPDRDTLKAAEEIAESIRSNIDRAGNIDIRNAYEIHKNLNKQYAKSDKSLRPYIKEAQKALKETLIAHSPKNPEFAKAWKDADDIYKYMNANNIVADFLEGIPFSGGKLFKFVPKLLDYLQAPSPRVLFHPAAKKYYIDLVDAVFKDNKGMALRAASKLAKQEKPGALEKQLSSEEPGIDLNGWEIVDEEPSDDLNGWEIVG